MTTAPTPEKNPAEMALILRYKTIIGYVPPMFSDVIRVLAHPDVIDYTLAFLAEQDSRDE